jgi:ketosteroid isomerase-like protein
MDPEIEWVNPPEAVEAGTRRGREGFEGAQSSFGRAYSSATMDVESQAERGDTIGLIVQTLYRGRGSGIEVQQRLGLAFTIRDGKVVRFEWSRKPEELLDRVLTAGDG